MLNVFPIPAFYDNYIWAISNPEGMTVVVDPGDANPVITSLEEKKLTLVGILITHHHADHTGGISKLVKYKKVPVYGPNSQNIKGITKRYKDGEKCYLNKLQLEFKIIEIPGHTLDHIAFINNERVFCGDTLFMAGCGRLFEGTPRQMLNSLNKIKSLTSNPLLYCAHEYTEKNLMFAELVEPNNIDIQQRLLDTKKLRQQNISTVPANLEIELLTNPFLRIDQPNVIESIQKQYNYSGNTPEKLFELLRKWKDSF